jgi:hypothetical protein
MKNLPPAVEATTSRYLELIDQALPGQVEPAQVEPGQVIGLYLTGSIPLGDFQLGESDLDGVVVVAEPLKDASTVQEVHAALPSKPSFDVTYLTLDDLALPPDGTSRWSSRLTGCSRKCPTAARSRPCCGPSWPATLWS